MTGIISVEMFYKEAKTMDIVLDRCEFQKCFPCFQKKMLLVHNRIAHTTLCTFNNVSFPP